jgi:hypothetical protein
MSALVDFYHGQATDSEGRSLAEIWKWGDEELELVHDFIQWLFPLPEPSQFNARAPLLTDADIAAFRAEPVLRSNVLKSFERILRFLGLAQDNGGKIIVGPTFDSRAADVWLAPNHNWLRITRILRSLRLLGLEQQAQALFARLEALFRSGQYPIPPDTFQFWKSAVTA